MVKLPKITDRFFAPQAEMPHSDDGTTVTAITTTDKSNDPPQILHKGVFITLEGGEGAGKSTQQKLLAARLRKLGLEVVETREPGGTVAAEILRHCLLSGQVRDFGGLAEALLFNAARLDHIQHLIKPALARGAFVICDRFSDSTKVYQHVIGKVSKDSLTALEKLVLAETSPDLTLVLDIDVRLATVRLLERMQQNGVAQDRFESERLSVHQALRTALLALVEDHPQRCVLIDAAGDVSTTHERIFAKVAQRFMRHHPLLTKAYEDLLGQSAQFRNTMVAAK